jgi:translation elongation factor EF-Tu-like GTPase
MFQRKGFSVEIVGTIGTESETEAELTASELRNVLDKYEVSVKVAPVSVAAMLPADQAEKDALDEAAMKPE